MTGKVMVAVKRPAAAEPEAWADALRAGRPSDVERYVVNVSLKSRREPFADAVLEVVCGAVGEPRAEGDLEAVRARLPFLEGMPVAVYWVAERVKLEFDRTWPDGQATPGVKAMYFAERLPGSSRQEFDDHWNHVHAPLALRHHIGMWRYVQNAVVAHAGTAMPDVDGIAELWFPTREDFEERLIDGPEGMAVITDDIAKFAQARGISMHLMTETIVQSSPDTQRT